MQPLGLYLHIPEPGSSAPPTFLAQIVPVDPCPKDSLEIWNQLLQCPDNNDPSRSTSTTKIIMEGYTRDGWAWRPSPLFHTITVKEQSSSQSQSSALKGFVQYLQQRKKCAYARMPHNPALVVVSYVQPTLSQQIITTMEIRVARDRMQLPNCSLRPPTNTSKSSHTSTTPSKSHKNTRPPHTNSSSSAPATKTTTTTHGITTTTTSQGGLLGKLVGAQHRTNHNVALASATTIRPPASASSVQSPQASVVQSQSQSQSSHSMPEKQPSFLPANQVLTEIREKLLQKMLDIDISPASMETVQVTLHDYTKRVSPEEQDKINMKVVKYLVYEAAEEVNEEWIVYEQKETSFVDHVNFQIYKDEGLVPPEVWEEMNKAELPEEVKGQQRAIQNEKSKLIQQAEQKYSLELEKAAHQDLHGEQDSDGMGGTDPSIAVLNQKKRDRRTIEDYEREKNKRSKP